MTTLREAYDRIFEMEKEILRLKDEIREGELKIAKLRRKVADMEHRITVFGAIYEADEE